MGATKNYGWTTTEQTDAFDVPQSINVPVEQIDESLKTVDDKADAASTAAGEAASKADASATDVTTLKEQMAGTTDSGLKTLIDAKQSPLKAGRDIEIADDTVSLALNATNGTGENALVEGNATTATGDYAHAEGDATQASGIGSHAEGYNSVASGRYSHAEGFATGTGFTGGTYDGATGDYSHAEGHTVTASGLASHAEGHETEAEGRYSHAQGRHCGASGEVGNSQGYFCFANAPFSTAIGSWCIAMRRHQHVFGYAPKIDGTYDQRATRGKYVEIVGIGNDVGDYQPAITDSDRDNGRTLDWTGNEWCKNDVRCGGLDSDRATYSLAAIGATVATIPATEYGYSDELTVPAGSEIVATITFGSEKKEAPNMQCSVQDKSETMHKLTCCIGAVTTTTASVTVWNDSDTDATAVIDWLAISGR